MSTSLQIRPFIEQNTVRLCYAMKKAVGERFWGNDGSLGGPRLILTREDSCAIAFFNGLVAADYDEISDDARQILEMLGKYDKIELFVE